LSISPMSLPKVARQQARLCSKQTVTCC